MMRRVPLWIFVLFFLLVKESAAEEFERIFQDFTMRVDLYHTGTKDVDMYSLDEILVEGPWAGSRTKLIDDRNLGKNIFFVYDAGTNRLIFSRGFSSLFGEWQTTGEAASGIYRTFSESVRFPCPKKEIQLLIKTRDKHGSLREIFSTLIDPASRFVNREIRGRGVEVIPLSENGPPGKKVDLLVMGDGYTGSEKEKFLGDGKRLMGVLFDTSPFKERKGDFNVRLLFSESWDSGADEPRKGVFRHTPFGISFNALDLPRYALTPENKAIRNVSAQAPYDAQILIFNTPRYGGGGIFGLYATSCSDNEWADYIVVHEFGHSFAGLADEYYSSEVSYEEFYPKGVEPWEPNITALLPGKEVKWRSQMDEGTPIPTPWGKEEYDALAVQNLQEKMREHIKSQKYLGKVGCFEGAGYLSSGMYRPSIDCIMFSKSREGFCAVCRKAIERCIDFHMGKEN